MERISDKEILYELDHLIGTYREQVKWNQYNAKPLQLPWNDNGVKRFNEIYTYIYANLNNNWRKIERTKSGGIKNGMHTNIRAWDCRFTSSNVTITICYSTRLYVVNIGRKFTKEESIYPDQAFRLFKEKCAANGIDLDSMRIENGQEVKATIEKPYIVMYNHMCESDAPLENCHHIDYHSSYPAGLCNTHPEFRKVIEPIYENRKKHPSNKAILNYTIGWMQSYEPEKRRFANWAHLSRDAIADNNRRIEAMTNKLIAHGNKILGYNTDGIWYQGEMYHDADEGPKLGQWHHDYTNCLFRSKSNGSYEFIENGMYYPVVRGSTKLDKIKDRTMWQWGDIYNAGDIKKYSFLEGIGIIYEQEKE